MGCAEKCAKLLLFLLNVILFLAGALILSLCTFLLVDKASLLRLLTQIPGANENVHDATAQMAFLENGAYVFMAASAFVLAVSFCGCFGAIKESRCLLMTYAATVSLVILLEAVSAVCCYLYSDNVENLLTGFFSALLRDYYNGATLTASGLSLGRDVTGISDAVDLIQVYFSCCGVNNYTDYEAATRWNDTISGTDSGVPYVITDAAVPVACCHMASPTRWPYDLDSVTFTDLSSCLTTADANATNIHGCATVVKVKLLEYFDVLMYVSLVVGGTEALGIICACSLYRKLASKHKVNSVI